MDNHDDDIGEVVVDQTLDYPDDFEAQSEEEKKSETQDAIEVSSADDLELSSSYSSSVAAK